jgi:hypothetical protein
MKDFVTIVFKNHDASGRLKNIRIVCAKDSAADVMAWYGTYFSGGDYVVYADGKHVRTGVNGGPEPLVIDA